jgi:hypothetical protein
MSSSQPPHALHFDFAFECLERARLLLPATAESLDTDPALVLLIAQALDRTASVPMPASPMPAFAKMLEVCHDHAATVPATWRAAVLLLLVAGAPAPGELRERWSAKELMRPVRLWFAAFDRSLGYPPPAELRLHYLLLAVYVLARFGLPRFGLPASAIDEAFREAYKRLTGLWANEPAPAARANSAPFGPGVAPGLKKEWKQAQARLSRTDAVCHLTMALAFLHHLHACLLVDQPELNETRAPATDKLYSVIRTELRQAKGHCALALAARGIAGVLHEIPVFWELKDPKRTRNAEEFAASLPPAFRRYEAGPPLCVDTACDRLDGLAASNLHVAARLAEAFAARLLDPLRWCLTTGAGPEADEAHDALFNMVRARPKAAYPIGQRGETRAETEAYYQRMSRRAMGARATLAVEIHRALDRLAPEPPFTPPSPCSLCQRRTFVAPHAPVDALRKVMLEWPALVASDVLCSQR